MSRSPTRRYSTAELYARSIAFAVGTLPPTVIFGLLAPLMFPVPYRWRYRMITCWTHIMLWWLETTCHIRCCIEGRENIPSTPTVVLSKHESAWETMALQRLFNPQVWVLKRELLWVPLIGWALAVLRPIAIDRKSGRRAITQVIEQGRKRLESGCWVVVFPEGTRVAPGKKLRYRLGGATLAQSTGHPVVPVAHNAGDCWPRNSFLKRPGTIRLVVGPVIESNGRRVEEVNALAETWIESTVASIRRQADRPPPGPEETSRAAGESV